MNTCKYPPCSNTTTTKFCSPSCAGKFGSIGRIRSVNSCQLCGSETYNAKYCSRSCSATANNSLYPKKSKTLKFCSIKDCLNELPTKRATLCVEHNPLLVDYDNLTIGQLRLGRTAHRFSTIVRSRARINFRNSNKPAICIFCGYSLSIEVAHLHAISAYSSDTVLAVVNHIDNLEAMCRNCHWEFDNGYLTLEQRR